MQYHTVLRLPCLNVWHVSFDLFVLSPASRGTADRPKLGDNSQEQQQPPQGRAHDVSQGTRITTSSPSSSFISPEQSKHHQQPHRHHHGHRRCKDNRIQDLRRCLCCLCSASASASAFASVSIFQISFAFRGARTRLLPHSRATRFADRTFQPCPVFCPNVRVL